MYNMIVCHDNNVYDVYDQVHRNGNIRNNAMEPNLAEGS